MKKYFLVCTCFLISTVTLADDAISKVCAGGAGTVIMGNNGTEYCMSNNGMTWWTALGWCQAIGKTPFRYPEDCRCIGSGCPETMTKCPNLAEVGKGLYVWTSMPSGDTNAWLVALSDGHANADNRLVNNKKALCF